MDWLYYRISGTQNFLEISASKTETEHNQLQWKIFTNGSLSSGMNFIKNLTHQLKTAH